MFLGVSGTVGRVKVPAEFRADLALRVQGEVLTQFKGNKKAAYTRVGLNSGTWSRVEDGMSVKETTEVAVIGTLWPETAGDWRKITPPLKATSEPDTAAAVLASNLPDPVKAQVLEALEVRAEEDQATGS